MTTLPKAIIGLNTNYMEINWTIVIIVAVAAVALLYYFIRRNQKDQEKIEKEMNYMPKTQDDEAADEAKRL